MKTADKMVRTVPFWKSCSTVLWVFLILCIVSTVLHNCGHDAWGNTWGLFHKCTDNLKCIFWTACEAAKCYDGTGEETRELPPGMTLYDLIREPDPAALFGSEEDRFVCPKDGQPYLVFPVSAAEVLNYFQYEAKVRDGAKPERELRAFPLAMCPGTHSKLGEINDPQYVLILYSDGTIKTKTPEEAEAIAAGLSLRPIGPSKPKDKWKWLKDLTKIR